MKTNIQLYVCTCAGLTCAAAACPEWYYPGNSWKAQCKERRWKLKSFLIIGVCMYVCQYKYSNLCMYINLCMYVCISIYVRMYVYQCMYVCMYVFVYAGLGVVRSDRRCPRKIACSAPASRPHLRNLPICFQVCMYVCMYEEMVSMVWWRCLVYITFTIFFVQFFWIDIYVCMYIYLYLFIFIY